MFASNLKDINNDVQNLVKEAQLLFQEAAALTGAKADETRSRGMQLLDKAMAITHNLQAVTIVAGKEMAATAISYGKANPWRTMAVAAGAGILLGILLRRA